jgi:transposase-like protein
MLGNRAVAPYDSMASHRLSHAAKHKFYPVPGVEIPLLKETPACKDLNNIIEADHCALKRVIRPRRGFQVMKTASATTFQKVLDSSCCADKNLRHSW